jgi:hypothetical protein
MNMVDADSKEFDREYVLRQDYEVLCEDYADLYREIVEVFRALKTDTTGTLQAAIDEMLALADDGLDIEDHWLNAVVDWVHEPEPEPARPKRTPVINVGDTFAVDEATFMKKVVEGLNRRPGFKRTPVVDGKIVEG